MVRDHQGLWTEDWDALCAEMGRLSEARRKSGPAVSFSGVGRGCGLGQKLDRRCAPNDSFSFHNLQPPPGAPKFIMVHPSKDPS